METRTYTERSNARRAAKAAGIDPDLVFETGDGFAFPQDQSAETAPSQNGESGGIPSFLKRAPLTPEQQAVLDEKTKRANSPDRMIVMPKANGSKAKAAERKTEKRVDKNATLLKMLAGKGASVPALTKELGWLPHTLRARISRLSKSKSRGGEGLKIERERVDGITTYRIA